MAIINLKNQISRNGSVVSRHSELRAEHRRAYDAIRLSMSRSGSELSRLGLGAPVRAAFLSNDTKSGQNPYPLASLMHARGSAGGGRGGRTRVALLLSALWVAGGGEHSTSRPASFWARLMFLEDPDGAGARTIRASWAELEHRGFVSRAPTTTSGEVPTYTLLNETGDRTPYVIPKGRDGDLYFRVPETLWRSSLLTPETNRERHEPDGLTGPGLVMYLLALNIAGFARRPDGLVFPEATFKQRYGLGEGLRKKGLQNLVALGVLDRTLDSVDGAGTVGHRRHQRYVYNLVQGYEPPSVPRSSFA